MTSLDIEEAQCLIDFYDDEDGMYWHHRILFFQGPTGMWIVGTPDMEVEQADIAKHRVRPLRRGGAFLAALVGEIYSFDPLSDDQLMNLRSDAGALGRMLGYEVKVKDSAAGPARQWVIADIGEESFGEVVPDGIFANDTDFVVKGDTAR